MISRQTIVQAIRHVYASDEFWSLLLNDSQIKSGPYDGACLVCANALMQALQGGELVRIVSDIGHGQTEHYGVTVHDVIYDFDGDYTLPEDWIEHVAASENILNRTLHVAVGHDPLSTIANDPPAESDIAGYLRRAMLTYQDRP